MNWLGIISFYFKHTKGYRVYIFFFFLITFLMGFESSFFNYAISYIIGKMSNSHRDYNLHFLYFTVIFIVGVCLFEAFYALDRFVVSRSIPYINRNILMAVYKRIQSMQFIFFKKKPLGEISNRIALLHDNFEDLFFDLGHDTPKECFRVIVSLCSLIGVNTILGCITTVWACVFSFVVYKISVKITECTYTEYNCGHAIAGKITDRILNIQTIFTFSTENKESKRLEGEYNSEYIKAELKTYKYRIMLFLCGGGLYTIMVIFFFFAIIYLKNNDLLSITTAAFALQQFFVVGRTLWYINTCLQDVLREFSALRSVMKYFYDESLAVRTEENLPRIKATAFKIEFRNVTFSYDNEADDILTDFNLIINPAERIGIVGESGVGKTSILALLLKLFPCSSGKILLNDFDINLVDVDSLREQMSVIPQETILFNRSIMENIKYGCVNVSDEDVYEICKKIKIHDAISGLPLGYDSPAGERGMNLSGGQRQKISIARAFLRKSPILLLDEITSALDTISEKSVMDSLETLCKELNPMVISVAHKLSTLRNMDRIIVIDKGKIVGQGTHEELITKDNCFYAKLWEEQKKGYLN